MKAEKGNTVSIHYIGTLDNGRIFDSTEGRDPLSFRIGAGEVFPALERAVTSMQVGEVKNLVIPAAQAYGARVEANLLKLPLASFPADRELKVGQKLSLDFADGGSRVMLVVEIGENQVTLDGNHPLAGLDLTFALKLQSIG